MIHVFGPTFRGEDGLFAPSERLEVWWNTEFPHSMVASEPIDPGRAIHLTTVRHMDRCRFRASFAVPDVRPGAYRIRTFVLYEGGYGWFGNHRFAVEPA
jgi:hypothetical protein